jgi:hypothetical protein
MGFSIRRGATPKPLSSTKQSIRFESTEISGKLVVERLNLPRLHHKQPSHAWSWQPTLPTPPHPHQVSSAHQFHGQTYPLVKIPGLAEAQAGSHLENFRGLEFAILPTFCLF